MWEMVVAMTTFRPGSRTIGEELAATMMRLGANDYLLKDRLDALATPSATPGTKQPACGGRTEPAEAALQESETRFRRLAENAQDLIFRFRAERGALTT